MRKQVHAIPVQQSGIPAETVVRGRLALPDICHAWWRRPFRLGPRPRGAGEAGAGRPGRAFQWPPGFYVYAANAVARQTAAAIPGSFLLKELDEAPLADQVKD